MRKVSVSLPKIYLQFDSSLLSLLKFTYVNTALYKVILKYQIISYNCNRLNRLRMVNSLHTIASKHKYW